MAQRFAFVDPHARDLLDVRDSNRNYWETSGNPSRKTALCARGPGSGGHHGPQAVRRRRLGEAAEGSRRRGERLCGTSAGRSSLQESRCGPGSPPSP